MSDDKAFKAGHPDVLAAWDEGQRQHEDFIERAKQAEDRFGRRVWVRSFPGMPKKAIGLDIVVMGNCRIPDGWVQLKRLDYLTPNKRTAVGKREEEWLDSLVDVDMGALLKPFGVPRDSMSIELQEFAGRIYLYGAGRYGNAVYIWWDAAVKWEGSDYFKPVKLSEL